MKVRDSLKAAGEHDLLIPPKICAIDKYGRMFAGIDNAGKRGLLLFVALSDEEMAEIEGR